MQGEASVALQRPVIPKLSKAQNHKRELGRITRPHPLLGHLLHVCAPALRCSTRRVVRCTTLLTLTDPSSVHRPAFVCARSTGVYGPYVRSRTCRNRIPQHAHPRHAKRCLPAPCGHSDRAGRPSGAPLLSPTKRSLCTTCRIYTSSRHASRTYRIKLSLSLRTDNDNFSSPQPRTPHHFHCRLPS